MLDPHDGWLSLNLNYQAATTFPTTIDNYQAAAEPKPCKTKTN